MFANLPVKLGEEELDEIMADADPDDAGTVNIAAFNEKLFS